MWYNQYQYNNNSYYNNYQQPPYIGNINNMGYNIYNNPYYYYNPEYIRQQEEQRRRELESSQNAQIYVWNKIINARNKYYGIDEVYTEDMIREQYHMQMINQQQMINDNQFVSNCYDITMKALSKLNAQNNIVQQQEQYQPPQPKSNKNLLEWLNTDAQERYIEHLEAESRKSYNTSTLYNSNGYQQLVNSHNMSYNSTFNSLNPNVTIDDMEIQISLPEHIKRERDIRRQKFTESLMRGAC